MEAFMHLLKYHCITIIFVLLFSLFAGITGSRMVSSFEQDFSIPPNPLPPIRNIETADFDIYKKIYDRVLLPGIGEVEPGSPSKNLFLIGTVTGDKGITRALILAKDDREPVYYRIGDQVQGYNLVSVEKSQIRLRRRDQTITLNVFKQ